MLKALIVDDEEDIREGLRDIIDWQEKGFVVVGLAEDGRDALDRYQIDKIDLVVTDIRMPRLDGLELSGFIKAINPRVKIMIISGYDEFSYAKKAMKYGIENYLLKPVDIKELQDELDSIRIQIFEDIYLKRSDELRQEALRSYFLTRLVNGDFQIEAASEEARRYGIDLNNGMFSVLIVDFQGNKDDIYLGVDEYQLKAFSIKNVLGEITAQHSNSILFEYTKSRIGIFLWSCMDTGVLDDQADRLIGEIMQNVPKFTKHHLWIGQGHTVASSTDIPSSRQRAESSLDRQLSMPASNRDEFEPVEKYPLKNSDQHSHDIIEFINEHYNEDLNLKRLSEIFYLNPYYIGKLIKRKKGKSFNEYMNKVRVERAKRLLETPVLSITEISEQVGYNFLNHFYKIFKDVTGMNPGEYRKIRQQR